MMTPEAMDMSPSRILPPPPRKRRERSPTVPLNRPETVAAVAPASLSFVPDNPFADEIDDAQLDAIERDVIQRQEDAKAETVRHDLDLRDDLDTAAVETETVERIEEVRQIDARLDAAHDDRMAAVMHDRKAMDDNIAAYLADRPRRLEAERARREKPPVVFEKTLDAQDFAKKAEGLMKLAGLLFLAFSGRKKAKPMPVLSLPDQSPTTFLRSTADAVPLVGERLRKSVEEKERQAWTATASEARAYEAFGDYRMFHALGRVLNGKAGDREKAMVAGISPAMADLVNGRLPDELVRQQNGYRAMEGRGYRNQAQIAETMLDRVVTGAEKAVAARNAEPKPEEKPGTPPDNGGLAMQPAAHKPSHATGPTLPSGMGSPF